MATVDVLIITALEMERDAFRLAAGWSGEAGRGVKVWETMDSDRYPDYLLGRYHLADGDAITLALARPTRMGGVVMSNAVSTLLQRLKPRALAMCGVCAGNPSDVALGDVVIASTVFQYDEGKRTLDGFEGDLFPTPMDVRWLQRANDLRPEGLPSHGNPSKSDTTLWLLERFASGTNPAAHPAFARYVRSSDWPDHVRRLERRHLIRRKGRAFDITDEGESHLERSLAYVAGSPVKLPFAIKVGPIASGNAVVKDGKTWETLKSVGQRSAIALEMEAASIGVAGYTNNLSHWIVVKGVMDHADPNKNDRYKPFAARASAEVLLHFLHQNVEDIRQSADRNAGGELTKPHPKESAVQFEELNFSTYLKSVTDSYHAWLKIYTPTDAVNSDSLDFDLKVDSASNGEEMEGGEKLPVLSALKKYLDVDIHVLLVGRPGSGKSTALIRLLLEKSSLALAGQTKVIPILVELRYWDIGIIERIRAFLQKHDPTICPDDKYLASMLRDGCFTLLIDGVNELPSEEARGKLISFINDHPKVRMVVTTRALGAAFELGIRRKVEMLPLDISQMGHFVEAYAFDLGDTILKRLAEFNLLDFCRTPLLLWMVCEMYTQSPRDNWPSNLAAVFGKFLELYENSCLRKNEVALMKGDVRSSSDRRLWKPALMALALEMMDGEGDVNLRLTINKFEAAEKLKIHLEKTFSYALDIVDDLLKFHLIESFSTSELEFRHQLVQEYYAAENIALRLKYLGDEQISAEYLNYFKWTEPMKMVVSILRSDASISRILSIALTVDLKLAQSLAASVEKSAFAPNAKIHQVVKEIEDQPLPLDFLRATPSYNLPDVFNLSSMLRQSLCKASAIIETAERMHVDRLDMESNDEGASLKPASNASWATVSSIIAEIDGALNSILSVGRPTGEQLLMLATAIEKASNHRCLELTKKLLDLVKDEFYLAKRCSALLLMNCSQEHRPGESSGYRAPQRVSMRKSWRGISPYSLPFALVGWLGLLTDRYVGIRANAINFAENFPSETSMPIIISMMRDDGIFHDEKEKYNFYYVNERAEALLEDAIRVDDEPKVGECLSLLKSILPFCAGRGDRKQSMVQGLISKIQSRFLCYDYKLLKRN